MQCAFCPRANPGISSFWATLADLDLPHLKFTPGNFLFFYCFAGDHFMQLKALASAVALSLLSLSAARAAEEKSVAVTAIVEHPALDAVRDGVQAALKEAGYEAGKNLKWQYQSAQGQHRAPLLMPASSSVTSPMRLLPSPPLRPRPLWPQRKMCRWCSPR